MDKQVSSVWLHDIGMFLGKEAEESDETTLIIHVYRSSHFIAQFTQEKFLPLDGLELRLVMNLCSFDGRKIPLEYFPEEKKGIRLKLIASIRQIAGIWDFHYAV